MNKSKLAVLLAVSTLFFTVSCVSTGIKGAGVTMTTNKATIVNYSGASVGADIPGWVIKAADGDFSRVAKDLDLKNKKVFVVQKSGSNKDFLEQWTNLIAIETEVAGQIERTVAQSIQASEWANQINDKTTINKTIDMYAASLKNVTLNGLEQNASYWIETKRLKSGINKAKTASDYFNEYTYFVVYSMDKSQFDAQIEAAMEDIKTNSDQSEMLRKHVTSKLQANIISGTSTVSTSKNDE